jgi:hypothetical protein
MRTLDIIIVSLFNYSITQSLLLGLSSIPLARRATAEERLLLSTTPLIHLLNFILMRNTFLSNDPRIESLHANGISLLSIALVLTSIGTSLYASYRLKMIRKKIIFLQAIPSVVIGTWAWLSLGLAAIVGGL